MDIKIPEEIGNYELSGSGFLKYLDKDRTGMKVEVQIFGLDNEKMQTIREFFNVFHSGMIKKDVSGDFKVYTRESNKWEIMVDQGSDLEFFVKTHVSNLESREKFVKYLAEQFAERKIGNSSDVNDPLDELFEGKRSFHSTLNDVFQRGFIDDLFNEMLLDLL